MFKLIRVPEYRSFAKFLDDNWADKACHIVVAEYESEVKAIEVKIYLDELNARMTPPSGSNHYIVGA